MKLTLILALLLATVSLMQAAPDSNPYQAIHSAYDLSGQPVREKRASYHGDYYICYPSRVVYSYHNDPSSLGSHRRSSYDYDSYARKNRGNLDHEVDYFGR
ncbi:hypothetical protein AWZ03_002778 [Drosophila navojoa]|uniref:Uncharacterized protein n=1 Tax=Drosophila navojoa TaxID=7232 RepID=A0A484BPP3_DRONA|nr:uncharacterized protein LOC108655228 [Drosophila navojoa]TDG50789.1 hypothetical protein AWZ03_002778 [Drosophila navojoa]